MAGAASSTTKPSGVRGVCPAGYYLPSNGEWIDLALATGGTGPTGTGGGAGHALKATSDWRNNKGTDEFGFSALPGGFRQLSNETFYGLGERGDWWTASAPNGGTSWRRNIDYFLAGLEQSNQNNGNGYSVRCLKD